MKPQLLTISVPEGAADRLCATFDDLHADQWWRAPLDDTGDKPRVLVTVLAKPDQAQSLMDRINDCLAQEDGWRVTLHTLDAAEPDLMTEEDEAALRTKSVTEAREALVASVREDAALTLDHLAMVALSAIVAGIGLNTDQIAAVIGAMVIAPFLGPIMGLALGVSLGLRRLLMSAGLALAAGVGTCLATSAALALVLPLNRDSSLLDYAQPLAPSALALALAAGAAAALSVATGRGSTLVGVMVAAAILPPMVAVGLLLSAGAGLEAARAAVLALANMICLTLAAQVVFAVKGIRPRRFSELKQAETSLRLNIATLGGLVAGLAVILWLWDVL